MHIKLHKILSICFFGFAAILFICLLTLINMRDFWISTQFLFFVLLLIILCCYISLHFAKNVWDFAHNKRYIWTICFFAYLFFLGYLLFLSKDFARDRIDFFALSNQSNMLDTYIKVLKNQWNVSVNLIPFASIRSMLSVMNNGYMQYTFVNLVGNLFAFMPFAFFLTILSKKMNTTRFFLDISIIVISVEIIQFFTFSGSMDIDDYILNVAGAMLFYGFLQLPFIRNYIAKIKHHIQ